MNVIEMKSQSKLEVVHVRIPARIRKEVREIVNRSEGELTESDIFRFIIVYFFSQPGYESILFGNGMGSE